MYMEKFEDVKDRICVFLINQEVNKDWINDVFYIPINDMAIVFYIAGRKDKKEEPAKYIEKSIYKKWEVDLEKIKTIALNNTERLLPAKTETPLEVLSHIYAETCNIRMEEAALLSDCLEESFYILSNEYDILGATCMLYKNMIKNFARMKRHNLILVSGSVHDVYIMLDDGKKSDAFYLNKLNTLNTLNIESDILT